MTAPSVGQTVHYVSHGTPVRPDGSQAYKPQCRAAIVTEVLALEGDEAAQAEVEHWDDDQRCRVGLAVLNPEGIFLKSGLHQDEHNRPGGSWHVLDRCSA